MPASRATSKTSPFATCRLRISSNVAGCIRTRETAHADRNVISFELTSTMRLAPESSKCVSSDIVQSLDRTLAAWEHDYSVRKPMRPLFGVSGGGAMNLMLVPRFKIPDCELETCAASSE